MSSNDPGIEAPQFRLTFLGANATVTGSRYLVQAGAAVVHREIADLSHTYPRDENAAILDWFLK